ncbi:MAG: MerR family DNA-binding transcriptional regulator [Alphaproteobacteria bacterium]|nr:MerR family DNA-binding transcriptional regulator [Alphaproteobacteria bacterium]
MDASPHSELYSVTELAEDLGITPRTLRFYEDKKLLTPRRAGNTRVYTHRDRGRMILILRGKRLGFSLSEIRDWLDLYESGPAQIGQMHKLVDKAGARLAALKQQRRDIDATINELTDIIGAADRHLAAAGKTKQAGKA